MAKRRRRTTSEWLREIIDRRDNMSEAARQSFEAFETAAREHEDTLERACRASETRKPPKEPHERLALRWLNVLAWTYAVMLERPDDDMPAVGAAQEAYDELIELAADWLDDVWWIERRLDDDEEAEAQRQAIERVTAGLPDPEDAAAAARAKVIERYRAAGDPLPRWLLGEEVSTAPRPHSTGG